MSNLKAQYYTIICDKKKKNQMIALMASYGAVGIDTVYGRGSVKAGAFAQALGFETEEHKVVLSALIPSAKAAELTAVLHSEYHFGTENTGIAFGIPVEGLAI